MECLSLIFIWAVSQFCFFFNLGGLLAIFWGVPMLRRRKSSVDIGARQNFREERHRAQRLGHRLRGLRRWRHPGLGRRREGTRDSRPRFLQLGRSLFFRYPPQISILLKTQHLKSPRWFALVRQIFQSCFPSRRTKEMGGNCSGSEKEGLDQAIGCICLVTPCLFLKTKGKQRQNHPF